MFTINPYLNFPGTTEKAFNFYKSVFGGEFLTLMRFKDTPEANRMPIELQNKIMHIALPIGEGNVLMATDAIGEMGHHLIAGNNYHISISINDKDQALKLFKDLSEGGKVAVDFHKEFWGAWFGMFTDKFGINWMVNCESKE